MESSAFDLVVSVVGLPFQLIDFIVRSVLSVVFFDILGF